MIEYDVFYKKECQGGKKMQRCEITGTGLISGNQISHSHRLTRRVWKPNLQVTTLVVNGSPIKVKVCARTLKTLKGDLHKLFLSAYRFILNISLHMP